MKKFFLLLTFLLLVGCSTETTIYMPSVDAPNGELSIELSNTYQLNELSEDYNLLKMHDTCYDMATDTIYAVGIMTDTVGYYQNGELSYLETRMGVGDFLLKDLACANGYLLVSTEDQVQIYKNNVLVEDLQFKQTIYGQGVTILEDFFMVPLADLGEFHIYAFDTFDRVAIVEGTAGEWFHIDDELVLLEMRNVNQINYYSTKNFELLRTEDIGVPCEFAAAVHDGEEFWYLCENAVYVNQESLTDIVPDPDQIYYSNDYITIITQNGFDDGTKGGYIGGVSIINSTSKETIDNLELEHLHKRGSSNDEYLVMTNNNDNSVTKLNLDTAEYELLQFGNSAEQGIVLKDGSVMVSNRLGGSTLFHIKNGNLAEIDVGEWPVGLVYDDDLNQAFSFDFLAGKISVIDPSTDTVVDEYNVGYEGETDAIGDLSYDPSRKILYAMIPERNEVVAIDALTGDIVSTIKLVDYGEDYLELAGAAVLTLVVHEPSGNIFIYASRVETLYIYDSNYQLMGELAIAQEKDFRNFPYSLFVDNYRDKVYAGSRVIDPYSFEIIEEVPTGYGVYAIDNDDGLLFSVDLIDEQEVLKILDTNYNELASINLANNQYVKGRFAYDQINNKFYAFYMVSAEVWEFDINIS